MNFLNTVTGCVSQCTWTTAALATGTALTTAALVAMRCTSNKRTAIEQLTNRGVDLSRVSGAQAAVKSSVAVADAAIAAVGDKNAQLKGELEAAKTALTDAKTAQAAKAAVEALANLINDNRATTYHDDAKSEDVRLFTDKQIADWIGAEVKAKAKTATAPAVAAVAPGVLVKAEADIKAGVTKLEESINAFAQRDQASKSDKLGFFSPAKYSPRREEIAFGIAALVSFCVAGGLWYTGTPVWTPAAPVVGVKA